MRIQEAAAQSGLSADTIRFYERERILPGPPRQPNGYREYTDSHLSTLRLASALRDLGLPMADLARILAAAHDGTCGDLQDVLAGTLEVAVARIDERLRELRVTRRKLDVISEGLTAMDTRKRDIPGATPCRCVELVME